MRIVPLIVVALLSSMIAAGAQSRAAVAAISSGEADDSLGYGDYLSARFAADHHDLGEAARYFGASLDHDPNNPQLLTFAFFYGVTAGQVESAGKFAQRLVVQTPDDRAARLTLAVIALRHGNYQEARAQVAKSAKGPFTSFTVALVDAWAAAGLRDEATAASDLKTLHAQHSADGLAYFNEALLNDLLGNRQEAEADFREALKVAGPTPRVIDAYGRFLERNGRGGDATALYQKVASDGGFAPVAAAGLARVAGGVKPDALVTHAGEGAAEALFGIAASLNDESSRDISVLYLRLALYLRPDFDLANLLLASRLESLERYDDAIAVYRGIGRDSPYYRMACVQIAVNDGRLGKSDDAIAALKGIAVSYPGDVESWTALGDAYRGADKYREAADAYSHAIAADGKPDKKSWPLYYARAIAYQQSDNWKGAEADLQLALQLDPDQPQVLNYLGYSWVDQRRHIPKALEMLEKARSLAPQDGYIVDSVGWAYYQLGRYVDAAKTLENAILLVPGDPTINDHLGDAYWRVGRRLDARFQWSHAIAFGADAGEKEKIEKKLQVGLGSDNRS